MQTEDNLSEENPEPEVEIYSKTAIWCFSIFISPIFGAILLMINMWKAGYKRDSFHVAAFTAFYYLVSLILLRVIAVNPMYLILPLNILATVVLAEYFFPKYFPEKDYYPKSIGVPLVIALLIIIGTGLMMMSNPQLHL